MSLRYDRTLADYYRDAEKTYEYTIKLANIKYDEVEERIEQVFDKLDLVSSSGFTEGPVMLKSKDFPNIPNVSVTTAKFETRYPATEDTIAEHIIRSVPAVLGKQLQTNMRIYSPAFGSIDDAETEAEKQTDTYEAVIATEITDAESKETTNEEVEVVEVKEPKPHFSLKDYMTGHKEQDIATYPAEREKPAFDNSAKPAAEGMSLFSDVKNEKPGA